METRVAGKPIFLLLFKQDMKKIYSLLTSLFIASNAMAAAEAPVETLDSGVKVQKMKTTQGLSPKASDVVKVHYRGTLQDGTEFDSSYKRGEPTTFPLSRVIPCWTQGVQRLKVGEKAKLFCPAKTAYGERGAGGVIPPNSDLNFEIELLGIQ
jgi:FKBP-type peptidyl-prolyl cis-trans isomerase FkpA